MINKKLISYLKRYSRRNVLCIFLIVVENVIWLVNTFFNIRLTNEAISQDKSAFLTTLLYSLISMVVLVIVKRVTELSEKKLSYFVVNDIRSDASLNLIEYTNASDFDSSGKYVSNLTTDVDYVRGNGLGSYFQIVRASVSILFSLIGAAFVHWSYLIIFPFTMLISLITPKLLSAKFEASSVFYSNSRENFISKITDIMNGFNVFKRNNSHKLFQDKITDFSVSFERDVYEYYKKTSLYQAFISFASILSQFIYILASLILVFLGYISVGSIVGLFNFSQSIYSGISMLFNSIGTISSINPIVEKFFPSFKNHELLDVNSVDEIKFEDVSISYGEKYVISSFSCEINKGEKVAIVGGSGSGKSTLVKSILKEVVPSKGVIKINNVDISSLSQDSIYRNVGIVSQDPYLFNFTIRDNIEFGDKFSNEKIQKMASRLDLSDFLIEENRLDTELKNNGENISGGQRQRLVILREILKNKDVIILDEGTSSLDKKSKDAIEDFLLKSQLTIIYIIHPRSEDELNKFDKVIRL